jgi:hypothetical protein
MAVITKTFRDFFNETIDHKRIQPRHFQILYEMAMWRDKPKDPVNIDKEDLEFLHQFPHKFWPKALHMRYQMLFSAIEKKHQEEQEVLKQVQHFVKEALSTQNWERLRGVLNDEEIDNLQSYYSRERISQLRSGHARRGQGDPLDEIAEKEAWDIVKNRNDHIDEPEGEVAFPIKTQDFDPETGKQLGSGASKPGSAGFPTFRAKPYLNRLYHKLERTRGKEHIGGSGLEGDLGKALGHERGQYGYAMHDPQRSPFAFGITMNDGEDILIHAFDEKDVPAALEAKGYDPKDVKEMVKKPLPHTTYGMKFPTEENIEKRVVEFMNLNSHRMFGDMPEDVKWMRTGYKDSWSIKFWKEKLQREIEGQLKAQGGKYESADERRYAAAQMVNGELIARAEKGLIKGPPIPGVAPEGFPITVTVVKKGKKAGQKELVPPDLYMPYHYVDVTTEDKEGKATKKQRLVPVVNPAHFYRELGYEDDDYAVDDQGHRIIDPVTKKPKWNVPPDKLRGHDKSFVHVDEHRPGTRGYGAKGAFQFNKDTHGQEYLGPADEDYEEAWDAVFGENGMQKGDLKGVGANTTFVPNPNGDYYEDIIRGILNCAKGNQCGDASPRERANIFAEIDALHSVISYMLSQTLRSEYMHGNDKKAQQYRRAFANNITSGYAQKDMGLGTGSRRLRKLGAFSGHASLDATTAGKEGGTQAITHDLDVADKRKIGLEGDDAGDRPQKAKRGKGTRFLDTSHQTTPGEHSPYNLENLRQTVKELIADAAALDEKKKQALELSKVQQGHAVIELLNRGIQDHGEIMDALTGLLATMFHKQGLKKDEALEEARSTMEGWLKEGHKGQDLVQQFAQHPMVQDAMQAVPQGQVQKVKQPSPLSDEDLELQKNASAWLHRKLEKIQGNPTLLQQELAKDESGLSKVISQMIGTYFSGVVDNKILDTLQDEVDQKYKVKKVEEPPKRAAAAKEEPPKRAAAREIAPKPTAPTAAVPTPAQPEAPPTVPIPTEDANDLMARKDWIKVAHHPAYLKATTENGMIHKRNLLAYLQKNKDKYQPHEHASAVANLKKAIGE